MSCAAARKPSAIGPGGSHEMSKGPSSDAERVHSNHPPGTRADLCTVADRTLVTRVRPVTPKPRPTISYAAQPLSQAYQWARCATSRGGPEASWPRRWRRTARSMRWPLGPRNGPQGLFECSNFPSDQSPLRNRTVDLLLTMDRRQVPRCRQQLDTCSGPLRVRCLPLACRMEP